MSGGAFLRRGMGIGFERGRDGIVVVVVVVVVVVRAGGSWLLELESMRRERRRNMAIFLWIVDCWLVGWFLFEGSGVAGLSWTWLRVVDGSCLVLGVGRSCCELWIMMAICWG